jgi:hypothetical protein
MKGEIMTEKKDTISRRSTQNNETKLVEQQTI